MMSSSKARRSVAPPPGSAAHKATVYSRFIPREELSSFAAWAPGNLSDDDNSFGAGVESGPASAEAESEQVAEKLRQARQNGYQDGYRDGLVALEGFKRSFAAQATQQLGALVGSIGGQLDALQQDMAEALAATALSLARQIVRSELAQRPEAVATVAAEAVESLLLNARHITLRVHPDDHPLVAEGAADVLAARGARLVSDPAIARGGCRAESDIGLVDASIETRWQHATAALGIEAPWTSPAVEPKA
ncbi:MAG: FliH/SctL family protein [Caldimonas sp.]